MKIIKYKKNKGVALLLTILMMGLIFFLSLYFLNFSLTEDKIAKSQSWGEKTYYLAEAGVAEMVWKLKNGADYKNNFETNPSWVASFVRLNPFGTNTGSYIATITNSNLANGEISSMGMIDLGNGKISQRIVKVSIYKALGSSAIGSTTAYANGNIDISSSNVNFYNGNVHSNNTFNVNGNTVMSVQGDIESTGNYNENWQATVSYTGAIHAANYPPAAANIDIPAVDFDSASPNSYLNRADIVYTENAFKTLMNNNPNLVLNNPITYITGDVEIEGMTSLTINGLLVVKGLVEIENIANSITINHATGSPSGIIAYDDVSIENLGGSMNINGIIYSADKVDITNIPSSASTINIIGSVISRKLTFTNVKEPFNITFDEEAVATALPGTTFSPLIIFDHWEEEY